jgi:uncharacterized delta-60 repeat protein
VLAGPGSLDSSFGDVGLVTLDIGSYDDSARAAAVQSDGKVVLAGYAANGIGLTDFAVARLLTNGAPDTTFHSTGSAAIAMSGSYDEAAGVAIQPDGRIVLAGYARVGASDDFAVARLEADGSLDASFGGTGKVTTPIGSSHDNAAAVVLQADGKIVAAGYARIGGIYQFAVARYQTNGVLDTAFNGLGKATTPFGTVDDRAHAVALQLDGKIIVAGASDNGTNTHFAVARYNSNGSLDATFDGDGKATIAVSGSAADGATGVQVLDDGRIVLCGYAGSYGSNCFALARLLTNGAPDTTFGSAGRVTTDFSATDDYAAALVLQGHPRDCGRVHSLRRQPELCPGALH